MRASTGPSGAASGDAAGGAVKRSMVISNSTISPFLHAFGAPSRAQHYFFKMREILFPRATAKCFAKMCSHSALLGKRFERADELGRALSTPDRT